MSLGSGIGSCITATPTMNWIVGAKYCMNPIQAMGTLDAAYPNSNRGIAVTGPRTAQLWI